MQNLIITLLICSVTMSALALIYMVTTPLLAKRYSVKWCYYTWIIVVIGLIIPFRPQLGNALIKVDVPSEQAAHITQTGSQLGERSVNQIANVQIGNRAPVAVTIPFPIENTTNHSALPSVIWWQIVTMVWLVGFIVFLVYHAVKHYRFAKMVNRWSENITDDNLLALLQNLKVELGISKQISIYQCSSISSPMMTGFINPRILMPKTDLAQDELRFVLKHELVHYKRKDLYYKCLILVATAIHWFNPVVYLMARAIEVQCELSCDAETVRSADAGIRQHYSETLISMVKYQSNLKTALSTNFYRGRKGMKKRIFSIMDMGTKRAGAAIFCMTLVFTLGTGIAAYGNVGNAISMPTGSDSSVSVGDIIQLGGYDWRVLEVKDGKALVLSDKVLLNMAYHLSDVPVTWESCDLRNYLNEQFYTSTFSAEEMGRIVETAVINNDNPWYGTDGGNDTTDKVFLLSIEEAVQYFGDSGELSKQQSGMDFFINDAFNEKRIAAIQTGVASSWWFRSPGMSYLACGGSNSAVAIVTASGGLAIEGDNANNVHGGVRPAMWLNL